jgi:5-(carboxyamino)imidazole ribonucleotide mutase
MPPGIPVASVAINGALNAGILACEILSLKYDNLKKVLLEYKNEMKKKVEEKNNALQQKIADL